MCHDSSSSKPPSASDRRLFSALHPNRSATPPADSRDSLAAAASIESAASTSVSSDSPPLSSASSVGGSSTEARLHVCLTSVEHSPSLELDRARDWAPRDASRTRAVGSSAGAPAISPHAPPTCPPSASESLLLPSTSCCSADERPRTLDRPESVVLRRELFARSGS